MAMTTALSTIKAKRGVALLLALSNGSVLTVDGMGAASAAVFFNLAPASEAAPGRTGTAGTEFNLDQLLDAVLTTGPASGPATRGPPAPGIGMEAPPGLAIPGIAGMAPAPPPAAASAPGGVP